MTVNEALELAQTFENSECISTSALALRALSRAYKELLEEYRAYEQASGYDRGFADGQDNNYRP